MSGWDDIANDQRVYRLQREATAELRNAEHYHGRTMALLAAALAELRRVAPDSPIHNALVQDKIEARGGWTIDHSSTFQSVSDLEFDLPAILSEVVDEHEQNKANVIYDLTRAVITQKRCFWRPWKTYGALGGLRYETVEVAEAARKRAICIAQDARLGDILDQKSLRLLEQAD
jgi:hypothetical protein